MKEIIDIKLNNDENFFLQRKSVLVNNVCETFLPLSLIEFGENIYAKVDTFGYEKLGNLSGLNFETILDIYREILDQIDHARQYLFFIGEYVLSLDSVYISLDRKTIRLVYIPEKRKIGGRKELLLLINEFKKICNVETREYIDIIYERTKEIKLNTNTIKNMLAELENEFLVINNNGGRIS